MRRKAQSSGGNMKNNFRLVVLFVVVTGLVIVYTLVRQADAPESAIIGRERDKLIADSDKARASQDPAYAAEIRNKAAFLDYQIALAYLKENRPDAAIPVLQKLIQDEEASGRGGVRRFRSFQREADYYQALATAYDLKHDASLSEDATEAKNRLLSEGQEAKRRERQEEGKWVGKSGD
jgi:hypothetical protein